MAVKQFNISFNGIGGGIHIASLYNSVPLRQHAFSDLMGCDFSMWPEVSGIDVRSGWMGNDSVHSLMFEEEWVGWAIAFVLCGKGMQTCQLRSRALSWLKQHCKSVWSRAQDHHKICFKSWATEPRQRDL